MSDGLRLRLIAVEPGADQPDADGPDADGPAAEPFSAVLTALRPWTASIDADGPVDLTLRTADGRTPFVMTADGDDGLTLFLSDRLPSLAELEQAALHLPTRAPARARETAGMVICALYPPAGVRVVVIDGQCRLTRRLSLGWIEYRFAHRGPITIVAAPELHDDLRADFPGLVITPPDDVPAGTVVFLTVNHIGSHALDDRLRRLAASGPCYAATPSGVITPVELSSCGGHLVPVPDEHTVPLRRGNIFARLVPYHQGGTWCLAPYGYFAMLSNGLGPVNAFGHRIAGDVGPLESRGSDHKLIVVFGGSSAFSVACRHPDMFAARLESKLNAAAAGGRLEFTVLNFGLSGNCLLNEISTYVLFCHRLRPDVVIAHNGFNDFVYGSINDPVLLGGSQMAYSPVFESWAQQLMGTSPDIPLTQRLDAVAVATNPPDTVVDVYLERVRQFAALVRGMGGHYVWGLQPVAFAKPLSADEREACAETVDGRHFYRPIIDRMPLLYQLAERRARAPEGAAFVNLQALFRRFGRGDELFADFVHLTPAGDEQVAEAYFRLIQREVFPGLADG